MRAKMPGKWKLSSRLSLHCRLTPAQRTRWERASVAVLAVLAVAAIFLLGIACLTDWDLQLADSAFDAKTQRFPLRHAWLTESFNHVILKRLFTVVALVFVLAVLWDLALPRQWNWLRRFQLRVVALSAVAVPAVIGLLKQASGSHCPWDLQRYGGTAPYIRLFEFLPAGVDPGHCMPAGHASSALWMISLSVFFIPSRLKLAAMSLAALLMVGVGVGWLQQLRGAHFLSHTLWSAWIALLTVFLIITCMDRAPTRRTITQAPLMA